MRLLIIVALTCYLQLGSSLAAVYDETRPLSAFLSTTLFYAIRAKDSSIVGVRQRVVGLCDKDNEMFHEVSFEEWLFIKDWKDREDVSSSEAIRQIDTYFDKMDRACAWQVDTQFSVMKRDSNNQSLPYPFGMEHSITYRYVNSIFTPRETIPCDEKQFVNYDCESIDGPISINEFSSKLDRMIHSGTILKLGDQYNKEIGFTNM